MEMQRKTNKGFTVAELMIVLVIIGVLASISTPYFLEYLKNQRLNGATRELYSALMNARMQSVSENRKIIVEIVSNHQYRFVRDANGNEVIDAGEATGASTDIHPAYPDITFSANFNPVFRPNGTGKNPVITISSSSTTKKNCIYISTAGRIRILTCS